MSKPRQKVDMTGAYRIDAWANHASGMGVPGVDKSPMTAYSFAGSMIPWSVLSLAYRYDWLARKICDRPAHDAVRRWIKMDDTTAKNELERLNARRQIKRAVAWARLYGGAAIVPIVEDGRTPIDPLDPATVRRVIEFRVVDRHHLSPIGGTVLDPYAMDFGEPEFYQTSTGARFHRSRVWRVTGVDLTQDEREREHYWGGSYVELYMQALREFQSANQHALHILEESSIGMLRIPELTQAAAMGGRIFDVVQKRLDAFNLSKSIYRTAAMDKEEEFDFKSRPLSGIGDLMGRFMTTVAGATDMTSLVLFGTAPSGLNASQEEQLAIYYDRVKSIQEEDVTPVLNNCIACLTRGSIPDWEYLALTEPSDEKSAQIRERETNAIKNVADIARLSPDEIVRHLNSTGYFDLPESGMEYDDYDDA